MMPLMNRLLTLAALGPALALGACAGVTAPDASAADHLYRCEEGRSFTASYAANGKTAVVRAGGLIRTLRLARSASGARYAGRGVELWGKGAAATLTGFPGGPYAGCATR
jgi:membrane-bound inhibitor of C-type lysozyme